MQVQGSARLAGCGLLVQARAVIGIRPIFSPKSFFPKVKYGNRTDAAFLRCAASGNAAGSPHRRLLPGACCTLACSSVGTQFHFE